MNDSSDNSKKRGKKYKPGCLPGGPRGTPRKLVGALLCINVFIIFILFYSYSDVFSNDEKSTSKPNTVILVKSTTTSRSSSSRSSSTTSSSTSEDIETTRYYNSREEDDINQIIARSNDQKAGGNFNEALKILDDGLKTYPKSDLLYTYKAGVYFDQQNWGEAEKYYKKAFELNPRSVWHASNVANVLGQQRKEVEAIQYQRYAYDIEPNTNRLYHLIWAMWNINDFSLYREKYDGLLQDIKNMIKLGQYAPPEPFVALHMDLNLKELQAISTSRAEGLRNRFAKDISNVYSTYPKPKEGRRIRVGYVSYDFRGHAVGIAFQDVLKYHNKSKFEVFAYNVCVQKKASYQQDSLYIKMKQDVEHMIDLEDMPLQQAADRIYSDGIDILVDIGLYTAGNRMDIFLAHPAPIQAAGVGLAVTTGASWIDYFIADNFVVPPESMKYYTEKLIFMPHSYHPFSHRNYYPIRPAPSRESLGLPKNKVLLCNHQGAVRLEPSILDKWAEILRRTENSVIVLKGFNSDRIKNIRKEFNNYGIPAHEEPSHPTNRVYFMSNAGKDEHIPQKSCCDIYLDTHFYNGHSTTGDMMWAGVPMITYPFESMAGRAAASFALSMGFPEMVVNSWEEYISRTVSLINNPDKLQGLRRKLENARVESPLFDSERWVNNLERGYEEAFNIWASGEKPRHIVVSEK